MSVEYIARPWERAGITHRQYDHWVSKGWVAGGNPGYGNPRHITRDQFHHLSLMARLVNHGMTPKAAHEWANTKKVKALLEVLDA